MIPYLWSFWLSLRGDTWLDGSPTSSDMARLSSSLHLWRSHFIHQISHSHWTQILMQERNCPCWLCHYEPGSPLMPDISTGWCRQQHWSSFALRGLRKLWWKWVLQAAFTASFHQPQVSLGLTATCKRSQSATQRYSGLIFFTPYRLLVKFKDSLVAYKLLPEIMAIIIIMMTNRYIVVAGKGHHHLGNHSFNSHKPHNNCPAPPHLWNKIMMSLLQVPSSHAITHCGRSTTSS